MSVEITIHQKGLLKNKISLETMLMNKFLYGVYNDDNYVLEEGGKVNNQAILYHPEHIARGITVIWKDNKDIELSLLLPTTNEEIDDFYELISHLCQLCHTNCFIQDGIEKTINELSPLKQDIKIVNYQSLQQILNDDSYDTSVLFCAMWPLHFCRTKVQHWLDDQDLSTFSKELHEFQKKDLYYANAKCYCVNREGEAQSIMGVYVVTATVDTIFPLKARVPYSCINLQTGEKVKVDYYVVYLASAKQNKVLGEVPFDAFVEELTKHELHEFDNEFIYFDGLSEEEIQRIYDLHHKKFND